MRSILPGTLVRLKKGNELGIAIIAYSFFLLYTVVKVMQFSAGLPWLLWTEEDQAIFAGIISFYFGQRAMSKLRQGK